MVTDDFRLDVKMLSPMSRVARRRLPQQSYSDEPRPDRPAADASACARNFEEAYEAYVDIKGQDREEVISGLRERVEGKQLQTRGELAQALGCSASALDALLQQHDLRNTDIGLKSTPGRKRHRQ